MITATIDGKEFELRTLNDCAGVVEALRIALLFEHTDAPGLTRYAEQHFLSALSHLDLAQRHLVIGWMENLDNR